MYSALPPWALRWGWSRGRFTAPDVLQEEGGKPSHCHLKWQRVPQPWPYWKQEWSLKGCDCQWHKSSSSRDGMSKIRENKMSLAKSLSLLLPVPSHPRCLFLWGLTARLRHREWLWMSECCWRVLGVLSTTHWGTEDLCLTHWDSGFEIAPIQLYRASHFLMSMNKKYGTASPKHCTGTLMLNCSLLGVTKFWIYR